MVDPQAKEAGSTSVLCTLSEFVKLSTLTCLSVYCAWTGKTAAATSARSRNKAGVFRTAVRTHRCICNFLLVEVPANRCPHGGDPGQPAPRGLRLMTNYITSYSTCLCEESCTIGLRSADALELTLVRQKGTRKSLRGAGFDAEPIEYRRGCPRHEQFWIFRSARGESL